MKRLITLIMAIALAGCLFTACGKDDSSKDVDAPITSPSPSPMQTEEPESDPNYQSVLSFWNEHKGFWVSKDNHIIELLIDKDGKAAVTYGVWGEEEVIKGMGTAVTSGDKSTYIITAHFPEVKAEGTTAAQKEQTLTFSADMSKLKDKQIALTNSKEEKKVYVFAGKTPEEVTKNTASVKAALKKVK